MNYTDYTTILTGILRELQPGALILAAGTRITVPPNVSTQDVPVGALVRVTVARSEQDDWIAQRIEHKLRRNGRGQ